MIEGNNGKPPFFSAVCLFIAFHPFDFAVQTVSDALRLSRRMDFSALRLSSVKMAAMIALPCSRSRKSTHDTRGLSRGVGRFRSRSCAWRMPIRIFVTGL
jgi:hypothetical protein